MARQINLVNPALRKTHEWPSAVSLAALAAVLLVLVAIGAVGAHLMAAARHTEADTPAANLKQTQEALDTVKQQVAQLKPDAALATELEQARAQYKRQLEVIERLDSGTLGDVKGFSEYLRGFARQVPQGLWLTGFTIGAGGHDMEVRGRMQSPALLTEYVRRLNAEEAFRGLSFDGLEIRKPGAGSVAAAPAEPAFTEFVLSTVPPGAQR